MMDSYGGRRRAASCNPGDGALLRFVNEEKQHPTRGKSQNRKVMTKAAAAAAAAPAVLAKSRRHNVQDSNHGVTLKKEKIAAPKVGGVKCSRTSTRVSRQMPKGAASPAAPAVETRNPNMVVAANKFEAAAAAEGGIQLEVCRLEKRLQDANLRMAEVVAQSAILVRDVRYAANKEISDVLSWVDTLSGPFEGFLRPSSLSQHSHSRSLQKNQQRATQEESASTQQKLALCRLMIAEMERQLEQSYVEKKKLESSFGSSVKTCLQLQDKLANQELVMQMERQARVQQSKWNEAALLVPSSRTEAEEYRKKLHEALLSKYEVECTLRTCIQSLCDTQREMRFCWSSAKRQQDMESTLQSKLQSLRIAEDQLEAQKGYLAELEAQLTFKWTVLECVWEGALHTWARCRPTFSGYRGNVSHSSAILQYEPALQESLIKSELQVEILSDKVEELKTVLDKVTSLLDCISNSGGVGNGTRVLIRQIIQQLQTFELNTSVY